MNERSGEDMRIKQALSHEPEMIPPIVREKMDRLYSSLPELAEDRRRYARGRRWRLGASIAALAAIIVTAALATPATTEWLRQLTSGGSSGSAFTLNAVVSGSNGKGLTVVDQGIKLTLDRVIYDGTKLAVGFLHEPGIQIKPRADMLHVNGISAKEVTQTEDDSKNETLLTFYGILGKTSDAFEMEIQVNNIVDSRGDKQEKVYGNWVFRATVQDWEKDVREVVYDPPLKASAEGIDLAVTGISVSPLTVKLSFEITDPTTDLREQGERNEGGALPKDDSKQDQALRFRVFDDLGTELELESGSGMSVGDGLRKYTAQFEMQNSDAKQLRLSLYEWSYAEGVPDQTVNVPLTTKTPFTVDLGESAIIEFRRIDLGQVKTTIDYAVKGDYPYQGIAWVVVNEWGTTDTSLLPDKKIKLAGEANSFRVEIDHLAEPSKYSIRALRASSANVRPIPGLELALPLEQQKE